MSIFDPPPSPGSPVVTITDNLPGIANRATGSVAYLFLFNESVWGLDVNDFIVINGTVNSVVGSGNFWTVNVLPAMDVATGTIGLTLQAGAVTNAAGNTNASSTNSSQALDTVAPTASFSPASGATGVATSANIVVTYSEAITLGTGSIVLKTAVGATVASYDAATSSNLTVSSSTLTINPTADLNYSTAYSVELAAGSIKDLAGNSYAGTKDFNFTTLAHGAADVNLMAYSWKVHTLLDGVSVSAGAHSGTTDANGATSFVAVTEPSLSLTASRAIPAAEASATSSAVNLQDAIAILKMIVGLPVNGAGQALSPYQALAADFNGDGTVGLTDAIGVLKHVVGLTAPDPTWHFVSETDPTVPGKANLNPGLPQSAVSVDLSATSPVHVGLVGYLSGDVDGSYAGAPGAADLDVTQPGYIATLVGSHTELSLAQFGV